MTLPKIPLAGVIGSPIAHSRSPQVHQHWLKLYGIAGHYIPMDVEKADLRQTLEALPKMGFVGVNITIPHKETILEIADEVTDRANVIGAANTLVFCEDGKIHADNTDGYGFIENLRAGASNWHPKSGPAVILGAGGAARAVISSLIDAGVPEIHLSNRTRNRAEQLKTVFGNSVRVHDWLQAGDIMKNAALVVNTTSLGMSGKAEMQVPLDGLAPDAVVTDLVYTPLETKLIKAAKELGCTTVDGLGMLLHQAVPAFEKWFGVRPEVDNAVRQAALR